MIGANLYIWSIFNQQTLSLIFFLLIIAIIGKVSAGIGAIGAKANKLAIGIGMIPRGGVALILAAFGLSTGLITNSIYSAVVVVIMITAMLVPPILKQLI
jgi:Kef-type K+ transport system membrane component KefB